MNTNVPTFTLDLSSMLNACEIKSIMKQLGVKYYCYMFMHRSTVMKIGMSADHDWMRGSFGERIYRQSFHIPGWPTIAAKGSAGSDMRDVLRNFPTINKNDVCIKVFDLTNIDFAAEMNPKKEVGDFECELLEWHDRTYGCLPLGNIRDERKMPKKAQVTDVLFRSLFDEE